VVKLILCCTLLISGTFVVGASASARVPERAALKVVRKQADALVARHRAMPQGGWAWRSAVQAPHFQTDRDVGAASIGEGLLAAYAVTGDRRYRRAAAAAGDFLLGVAEPAAGGLRWPDWADPDGERSTTHFTSTSPPRMVANSPPVGVYCSTSPTFFSKISALKSFL